MCSILRQIYRNRHSLAIPVNEFYKKGCQGKSSPSTGGREDFSLEIHPTVCKCPSISLEGVCSGLSALPVGFIFGDDDANRVLRQGKRNWSWSVNHGSIGGSWPIAIFWLSEEA